MNELVDQLLSYIRGIWRKRWYALGCAWLVCVIGWVGVFLLPDQYEASARVFVDTQTVLRPVLQGLTVDLNPNAQVELITRTLFSRPNLEKIAELTGVDRETKDSQEMDRLLTRLQQEIKFTKSGTDLYSITYLDRQPKSAKQMVQTVVDVFERNLVGNTQQGTDSAQRFLDQQITEYEHRLTEAENRLKEFKIKNTGRMPSEGQGYYARMQQTANDLETVRLELAQSQNRRNALQQQLGEALQQQPTGEDHDERERVMVFPIDSRIEALEQKLDQLLIQYTDKHPDVNILRQTIADLKKQRDREKSQYSAALAKSAPLVNSRNPKAYSFIDELKVKLAEEQANVASLQVRVGEYEKRTRELREQVNVLPQVEAELAALNRDYDTNRKKYDELLARREALRLAEQAEQSKQDVRYRVVDPPRVPAAPTGPKRVLLMSLVLAAGLGAGIGLALLLVQLWPTFDTRRSLFQQMSDIPVFGSVGLVLSQATLRHKRRMIFLFSLMGGMLLLIYAGLVAVEMAGLL